MVTARFHRAGAGAFTQPVLGTDAAGDLRQAVGLMGKRDRGGDIPRFNQLDPLRIWLCSGQVHSQILCSPRETAGGLLLRLLRVNG